MKAILSIIATAASLSLAAQSDSLRYPAQTPDQQAGVQKSWPVVRLAFQEFYEGNGTGIVKNPGKDWAAALDFRAASVRVVGRDSLLFKFETQTQYDSISLGQNNASKSEATILHIAKAPAKRATDFSPWWGWEVLVSWPWDVDYRDRKKPFQFYFFTHK